MDLDSGRREIIPEDIFRFVREHGKDSCSQTRIS